MDRGRDILLEALLDNLPVAIALKAARDGTYIVWNRSHVSLSGFKKEEVLGKTDYDILPRQQADLIREKDRESLQQRKTVVTPEEFYPSPILGARMLYTQRTPIFDERGEPMYILVISEDITRSSGAVKELEVLREEIEFILGATGTGFDIIDSSYNIRYIDPEWMKVYGDPGGKKCYEYFMGRKEICPGCGVATALKTKGRVVSEETLPREGNRPIQVITIPFKNKAGEWLCAEVNMDITERKRAEAALCESELRYRTIVENINDVLYVHNFKEIILDVNEAVGRMLGYTRGELIGAHLSKITTPQSARIVSEKMALLIKNGSMVFDSEEVRKDGRIIPVSISSKIVSPEGDGLVQSVVRDISERREAEERVRNQFKFQQALIDSIPIPVFYKSVDGRYLGCNVAFSNLTGQKKDSIAGKHAYDIALKDLADKHTRMDRAFFERPGSQEYESRLMDAEGVDRDVVFHKATFNNPDGSIGGLVGAVLDITERKAAAMKIQSVIEQQLKSLNDMLAILNQLRIGTAMTDEKGMITFLSDSGQFLTGKSSEEAQGKSWLEFFPFQEQEKSELEEMIKKPEHLRARLSVCMESEGKSKRWIEVEIHDDPRDPRRKIFHFYDVSDVYNLRRELGKKAKFHELVGKSKAMQRVYQQIQEIAQVDWTVLIEGETGSGKELAARAIHFTSRRRGKPFLAVNCAVFTDSLLASQLFGHKRGAFTGAVEDYKGLFEAASGGTLFLDEIGNVPLNIQTSLLRVVEQKEITPLGESVPRKVDVRVIAATNRSLDQAVEKGEFRADLLYRIRVARILLPPLRERRDDIPILVDTFLDRCRATSGKPVRRVSDKAMRMLISYHWPGNVRELKSAIEFAVMRCLGSEIEPEDLPPELQGPITKQAMAGMEYKDERERILDALKKANGKRVLAARLLDMSRATLYRRLQKLKIKSKR